MKVKKLYLTAMLIAIVVYSMVYINTVFAVQDEQINESAFNESPLPQNYLGANFKDGEIAYEISNAISHTTNTFQCVIRMEKNNETSNNSSVIFGNYNYYNAISNSVYEKNKYVNYEIDKNGNVVVDWAKETLTFTSTDVRTGEWIHIAVVRNEEEKCFKLYINGELVEISDSYVDIDLTGNAFRHRIGTHKETGVDKIFRGEIAHVSVYTSSRSQEEIYDDYSDILNVSYKNRSSDLVVSYNLEFGEDIIYDNSINNG